MFTRAGLMKISNRVAGSRYSGQLSRDARFSVRAPRLPPVIKMVNYRRVF